jgi:thioredoxin reductase (NADPH)
MEKLAIVGSGPAGLTSALYAARAGLAPLVFEGLEPGGQLTTTTEVENYPGFPDGIDGTELVGLMRRQAERFGARCVADEIVGCDFTGRPLKLKRSGGEQVEAACVIVATGASARYLGIESERRFMGKGVTACATCDGSFYRNQDVAVVGGGDTAMEEALFLTRMCSSVTVVHRRDELRASRIMARRAMEHPKIKFAWNSLVEEVLGDDRKGVTGLKLRDVRTDKLSELAVTGVFMAIGHKPNTDAFRGQLDTDDVGYLVVDGVRTKVAGVFAAGDVYDHVYRQAVTAAGSGCMAAIEAERYLQGLNV